MDKPKGLQQINYETLDTAGKVICLKTDESVLLNHNDHTVASIIRCNNSEKAKFTTDAFKVLSNDKLNVSDISDGYHTFRELYDFRKALHACLLNEWSREAGNPMMVHKSYKHYEGDPCFNGEYFIVIATTPYGEIRNHYKIEDWNLFNIPETETALTPWDGHTPQDTLAIILKCAANNV